MQKLETLTRTMGLTDLASWLVNDAAKAVIGAAALAGVSWAFGRFNSAMKTTAVITRAHASSDEKLDDLVLVLTLEKLPPTRVRLQGIELDVTDLSDAQLAELRAQFESAFGKVALVAGDTVTFQGHFCAPLW
jgi:hypothetical protein